ALSGADRLLGDRDEVHVVLDVDPRVRQAGRRQLGTQPGEQVGFVPAGQVAGEAEPTGARVDGAADADDDVVQGADVHPGGRAGRGQRLAYPVDGAAGRASWRHEGRLADGSPGQV